MVKNPTVAEAAIVALLSGAGLFGAMLLFSPLSQTNVGIAALFVCFSFFSGLRSERDSQGEQSKGSAAKSWTSNQLTQIALLVAAAIVGYGILYFVAGPGFTPVGVIAGVLVAGVLIAVVGRKRTHSQITS